MRLERLAAAAVVSSLCACEPQSAGVESPLRVNDTLCGAGTLPVDSPGLTVGVPADRPLRVQDEAGAFVAIEVVFGEGSDPAFSILRAPFAVADATIVPLRVQLTAAGTVGGTLLVTPAVGSPCELALSASDEG